MYSEILWKMSEDFFKLASKARFIHPSSPETLHERVLFRIVTQRRFYSLISQFL